MLSPIYSFGILLELLQFGRRGHRGLIEPGSALAGARVAPSRVLYFTQIEKNRFYYMLDCLGQFVASFQGAGGYLYENN